MRAARAERSVNIIWQDYRFKIHLDTNRVEAALQTGGDARFGQAVCAPEDGVEAGI